jgi:single-strand DNA-binding protein
MSSVNKVMLIGNLGRDPEVRTFQNGGKVCNLRIATSETWKDENTGERRERTEWHSVAIFSEPLVRVAEQYLRKGSKVYIEGQLETRKWQDQSGSDRYSTEVALRPFTGQITMLDSRSENVFQNDPETPSLPTEDAAPNKPSIDFDDEIPF